VRYSKAIGRVVARPRALSQLEYRELVRLRMIARDVDQGVPQSAAQTAWLADVLRRSTNAITLESRALVELLEAIAHHSKGNAPEALERLARCERLLEQAGQSAP
jgi:hypothetical protein